MSVAKISDKIHSGHPTRKSVFRVSSRERLKLVCSSTETSQKNEILLEASVEILSNKRLAMSQIRLHVCGYEDSHVRLLFTCTKVGFSRVETILILCIRFFNV